MTVIAHKTMNNLNLPAFPPIYCKERQEWSITFSRNWQGFWSLLECCVILFNLIYSYLKTVDTLINNDERFLVWFRLKAIQAEKYPVVKVKKPPGRPRADVNIADPEGENSNSIADDSMQGNEEDEEEEEEEEEYEDDDDDDDGEGGGDGTQSSDESEEDDVS